MFYIESLKNQIAKNCNQALGQEVVEASALSYPPNVEMGDLSLPCFEIAKKLGKQPGEVAGLLVSGIDKGDIIVSTKALGPYFNLTLNKEKMAEGVLTEIEKDKSKYGKNKSGKNKKVMIEYSNVNTHKEYHVGHLRNIFYGDAVNRIIAVNGYKAIPVSYVNDFGIHTAKTLWNFKSYLKENFEGKEPEENKGFILGKMYVDASQKSKDDSMAKQMIGGFMKKIESRQGEEYELWQKTRQWSIEQFKQIYKELDIEFKETFYESEVIDEGRKIVDELIEKGIFKKSEGAIIADLEEYGLGVLVVIRSDGTMTYPVADLALAKKKFKEFKLDKSIYVVDVRQALYFKQLFKILELLGHKEEMIHLGFDFVKLPSGMMSSRTGNVITYEELKKLMVDKAEEETKKRHVDWTDKKIKDTADILSIGAMKFEMIKVGADNIITFDIDKALDFSGYTAAYVQYVFARVQSILNKIKNQKSKIKNVDLKTLTEDKEKDLILKMAKYPEVVLKAGEKYDPSEIAKYLFELAQMFNDYYHAVPILKAEDKIKEARLALIDSVAQVIENGLELLGIKVVVEM